MGACQIEVEIEHESQGVYREKSGCSHRVRGGGERGMVGNLERVGHRNV